MKRPNKKGNLSIGSGLSLSNQNAPMIKTIKFGQTDYKARHVIIPAAELESKTIAHPLNTRHQESLTLEAVRDIYPEVLAEGIKQEGVAYFNKELERYELFDATRRRFCGIKAGRDLPLWVLDELPSAKDIAAYVELTQKVRFFSWREVGMKYLNYAEEQGISSDDLVQIGKEFGVSIVTIRKKLNAAKLNKALIESFPDCEGIPTTFYTRLGKIERTLAKTKLSVETFVENELASFNTKATDVSDIQAKLLEYYETKLELLVDDESKPQQKVEELAIYGNKNTYARLKTSADGRKKSFEFSRLPKELTEDIESYIRQKLSKNN
ncbi:hypothetical protein OA5_05370 [Vibrio cyclitrophicus 1F111]|uniref:ParB family protein n=1 Tax=Vibrio cyclitrophicus TaxID=47951 RepID=UPI0002EF56D5|nr:ParB family protein [Vibrio cyclitrophicus]OEF75567.1 hypothetical protein OA5_05370 [Vibrio cyclitrophicus 1F111]